MKKQFQSLTEKGRWLLATLTLIFTLGIGQMWAASEITVKLYVHGGTISADGWSSKSSGTYFQKKVAKNTQFDIPAPTQEGYSFVNWTVNEDGTGDSYTTSHSGSGSNITLHAQWLELPYTPTHLIDNKLKVNAEWNSKLYTTDATNITGLVDWQVAPGKDRTSNVTDKQTGKSDRTPAIFTTSTKEDDNYMYLSFTIASGKRLKLSAVNIPVFGISNSKTTLVEIEDAYSTKISVNGTITKDADGNGFGSYDFANVPYLKGTVTVKMWAYGSADGYRMKTPIYLDGAISDIPAVSAPSISAPDADQAAVYDLNDVIAPLEITASGYPTPTYQWYSNSSASTTGATAIEGAQSASYTPASNVASDLYYYCVATNSQGTATSHYFHVTVNAPAVPTIYTETTALTLTSNKIATASETFTFSGANLGATDVTLVLASAVDGLTLSESSVTPTAGAIADTEITVSYKSLLDVAETDVNLYLKQGDDILKTIVLTYSSTAGIESLTSISAATTWDWNGAADAAYGTLGQNDMIVLANADVTWDAGFNALAIAGKLQHYYRDSKYAQGHELKFNTTIPGRVTVTFSNTGGKDIARAPRITDDNGSYAPTDEADGSKNTTAKTYTHNVAAGDVLIAGFEMQTGTPANMLRYYKVEFVPTYTVAYAANGGSGDMMDANVYVVGDEVTLLENTFTPASGYIWSGWVATYNDGEVKTLTIENNKFTMPAYAVTVTAQWEDVSKVCKIGDDKYTSLEAALTAIKEGTATGTTIELIQNIDVTAQVEVEAGVTAVIDLAGHKIEYTGTSTLPSGVILVHNGASLTINDSSDPDAGSIVSGEKAYAAIALTKAGDDAANPATLVVNGGTLTGHYYGITGNGSRNNTVITINGGTITGTVGIAIYHPQVGTLTVNNGSLTGEDAAIEMRAGTLVINDGTFTATATVFSCDPNGSGSTTSGAAIAIAQHTTKKDIEVTINGGTFIGVKALNESNPQVNDPAPQVDLAITDGEFNGAVSTVDVDHFISGGIFDNEVTNDQCAENYVPKDNGDGTYGVKPKEGVAVISISVPNGNGNAQTIAAANISGYIGGTATQKLESGKTKLGSNGHYIGFSLSNSEVLKAGDIIRLNVSATNDATALTLYQEAAGTNLVKEIAWTATTGVNEFPLPDEAVGLNTLYIYRKTSACNPSLSNFSIYRVMKPQLLEMTIDGRDVVIDEENKTAEVTIPYEADLAALTVVPTIVWNEAAAENSIVVNNGAAWTLGANTYKLTDKDGDYTVYTITLTRDVLKHTVSYNTHGGSAVASELVEDGGYLAAAPAAPEKEDYLFQGWAETDGGAIVDVTTFAIYADKEFHAVWASDGAIKLIEAGAINHTNFITGATMSENPVTIETVDYDYALLGSTASNPSVNALNKLIAYNATTTKTKVMIDVYNKNTSARTVKIWGVVEGSSEYEELASITMDNGANKRIKSAYYEFNNLDGKNRTIYIGVPSSVGDVAFLQVKVVESGDPIHMFGEVGYSINFNKGRLFGPSATDLAFEGMTYNLSSGYQALSSTAISLNKNSSYRVDVASPVTMNVTTSNGSKFYVDQATDGTANETASTGAHEFDLTAGTWYINVAGSNLSVSSISFALPKCAEPVIGTQPATNHTFDPGDMTATVVATVTEGTLHYQWYKKATVGDDEAVGTDAATLTTTTEGTYYVVVTNTLAGHQDVSVTSDEAELGYRVTNDATLMALSYGGTAITLEDGVYNYNVELAKGTTDVPALAATATMGAYANVDINDAAEFVNYEASSTVTVKSEDLTETNVYTVNFYVKHDLPQVDVTESTTWDWTNAATTLQKIVPAKKDSVQLMANIDDNGKKLKNDAEFNSQALLFKGQEALANKNERWFAKGGHIKFNVTVPGIVKVEFSDNGGNNRRLKINDLVSDVASASETDVKTFAAYVEAGEVTLMGVKNDGTGTDQYIRISKIIFTAKATPDYTRNVSNNIGTLCVDHNVVAGGALGATFYQIASRNELYDYKIDFEEVLPNEELKAGEPYIFKSNTGKIELYYGETEADAPVAVRGMIGSFVDTQVDIDEENKSNILYIAQNKLWNCEDLVDDDLEVVANRAYIVMSDVPTYEEYQEELQQQQNSNNAPRRRVTLGKDEAQVVTGFGELETSETPVKVLINGQIFIIRGEKMFDVTGKLVK